MVRLDSVGAIAKAILVRHLRLLHHRRLVRPHHLDHYHRRRLLLPLLLLLRPRLGLLLRRCRYRCRPCSHLHLATRRLTLVLVSFVHIQVP